jgi:hypothetical protein
MRPITSITFRLCICPQASNSAVFPAVWVCAQAWFWPAIWRSCRYGLTCGSAVGEVFFALREHRHASFPAPCRGEAAILASRPLSIARFLDVGSYPGSPVVWLGPDAGTSWPVFCPPAAGPVLTVSQCETASHSVGQLFDDVARRRKTRVFRYPGLADDVLPISASSTRRVPSQLGRCIDGAIRSRFIAPNGAGQRPGARPPHRLSTSARQ